MIAEAINSISDFLTDIIALIFIRISGKPQDKDHHYGHGKFETLASVVMAVVMISVGVLLLYNSIISIIGLWMGTLQLPPSQPSDAYRRLRLPSDQALPLPLYLPVGRAAQELGTQGQGPRPPQ